MQDEVNEKIVSLCITGGKISARILKNAMLKALAKMEQETKRAQQKTADKRQEKNEAVYHGKQSMEKLMKQNCQLSNIEITDGNIKSFEKYARKYGVDYAITKDKSVLPPKYLVFFKARDADAMTAAFNAYSAEILAKNKRPSVLKTLHKLIDAVRDIPAKVVSRDKQREQSR